MKPMAVFDGIWKGVEDAHDKAQILTEALAEGLFGKPKPTKRDNLGPPRDAVDVECWHCRERYKSSELVYEYRLQNQWPAWQIYCDGGRDMVPLWWCRNKNCDGAGFGHDIHAVAPRRKK